MHVSFRPATLDDFDFCARLYFAGREHALQDTDLIADLRRRWEVADVRIILSEGADVGWLQTRVDEDALFVVQLFIDPSCQGRGMGSEVMHQVIEEGHRADRAVTLGVVKTNPAQRLYARLGFRVTHEDDRKFYMRRDVPQPRA